MNKSLKLEKAIDSILREQIKGDFAGLHDINIIFHRNFSKSYYEVEIKYRFNDEFDCNRSIPNDTIENMVDIIQYEINNSNLSYLS